MSKASFLGLIEIPSCLPMLCLTFSFHQASTRIGRNSIILCLWPRHCFLCGTRKVLQKHTRPLVSPLPRSVPVPTETSVGSKAIILGLMGRGEGRTTTSRPDETGCRTSSWITTQVNSDQRSANRGCPERLGCFLLPGLENSKESSVRNCHVAISSASPVFEPLSPRA